MLLWLLTIVFSCSTPAPVQDTPEQKIAAEVWTYANQYRTNHRLSALKRQPELDAIALRHSKDMAEGRVPFSHNGFNGRVNAVKRFAKVPYSVGENLYATTSEYFVASSAVKGWIESPGHKANLDGKWQFTGIGVARSRQGEYFITQLYVGKQ